MGAGGLIRAVTVVVVMATGATAACSGEDGGCHGLDERLDVSLSKVGDSERVTLDATDGYYDPFEALDEWWQDAEYNKALGADVESVDGTLALAETDKPSVLLDRTVPTKLVFTPDDGGPAVEFTTYGCA